MLYFLHGYTATAEAYVKSLAIPDSIDRAIAAGAREMIVVIPDAFTKCSGSMFSNSPTTGFWETFVADDLTAFIDKRTGPSRREMAAASPGTRWAATARCASA